MQSSDSARAFQHQFLHNPGDDARQGVSNRTQKMEAAFGFSGIGFAAMSFNERIIRCHRAATKAADLQTSIPGDTRLFNGITGLPALQRGRLLTPGCTTALYR